MRYFFLFIALLFPSLSYGLFLQGSPAVIPVPPPSITLPSANLVAIYSTIQYSGWSGNCLRIQRGSDSAQTDIGFSSGLMDINTAISFAGGSSISVVKIYDQSGNGNDIVISSSAPTIATANTINNIPGITFWNGTKASLPSSISLNSRSITVFTVSAYHNSFANSILWQLNTTWNGGVSILPRNGSGGDQDTILSNSGFNQTGIFSYSQPGVFVATSGSTQTYQFDEKLVTNITSPTSTTMTGGGLFYSPDLAYQGYGEFYTMAIYNTVIGQSTIQSNKNNLYSTFNIPTNLTCRVLWDGDSITLGTGSTNGINNPRQADPLVANPKCYFRNIGIYGQDMSTMYSQEASTVTASYDASLSTNIVLVAGGTNDITSGTMGANLWTASTLPYIQAAETAGYKVIVGTLIYNAAQTTGQNTERNTYNSLVKSNASTYNYAVADYDSIAQLQNPQTSGYSADGTHPTTLGYGLMAQIAATSINSVLAR